jgi:hypothetical protein
MSKNCKCKENEGLCKCKHESSRDKFYIGVDDVTQWRVHYDVYNKEVIFEEDPTCADMNQNSEYHWRLFGNKFVNDPLLAVMNVYSEDSRESNDPAFRRQFMENVRFCKENDCFYIDEFLTLGVELPPKQCQWDKFFAGEYEFICVRHEIQALETSVPKYNLKTIAKGIGFDEEVLTVPDAKFEERFSIDENCTDSFALRYSIEDLPVNKFKK